MFPHLGYLRVWGKLTAGLAGMDLPHPSEKALRDLRHTLLHGRVLRSGGRPGVEPELRALLTLYQMLRMAMVEAVETRPGINPDRASFTTALEAARNQLTAAAGICPPGPAELTVIGRARKREPGGGSLGLAGASAAVTIYRC